MHHARARIRHRRRTGIADQCDVLASLQTFDQPPGGTLLVVLMHGQQGRAQTEGIEQALAVAGILGGDAVDGGEHVERTRAEIAQVTEWRGDHIQ